MKYILLIASMALFVTSILANEYRAECIIHVIYPENSGTLYTADALRALTQTHAKLIATKPVLYSVIRNFLLTSSFSESGLLFSDKMTREQAADILRKNLLVLPVPETVGLISIQFNSPNPNEAARIANEIALVFIEQSSNTESQIRGTKIKMIDPAEALACKLVEKNEIPNHGLESTGAPPAAGTPETHP